MKLRKLAVATAFSWLVFPISFGTVQAAGQDGFVGADFSNLTLFVSGFVFMSLLGLLMADRSKPRVREFNPEADLAALRASFRPVNYRGRWN